jgi:hypothetical protein
MRRQLFFLTFLFSFSQIVVAQNSPISQWCPMNENSIDPPKRNGLISVEPNSTIIFPASAVITIPVVFHVVYNVNDPSQIVSQATIDAQIARLNMEFRGTNPENPPIGSGWAKADLKFEFKRACIDPQGQSTNGILYIPTTHGPFSGVPPGDQGYLEASLTAEGGHDAWPTDTYLNIWICDVVGLGGSGRFPWTRFGTVTVNGNIYPASAVDGVVVHYGSVGDPSPDSWFNKGRVLVHEVGHWLGLYHVFGSPCSPGDYVADTPPEENGASYCRNFPYTDNCSPNFPGVMYMNQMNDPQDDCRIFFTEGQKTRARSYYTDPGPYGSRFPFVQNYFGFTQCPNVTVIPVNRRITLPINNPACLPVTYTVNGPVTIISQKLQSIVLEVACGSSGTINIIAQTTGYLDECTFNFADPGCGVWPKVYFGDKYVQLSGDVNNLFFKTNLHDINPNINHLGASPTAPFIPEYIFHYNTSNSISNWYKDNTGYDAFLLSSRDVQIYTPPGYNFSFFTASSGAPSLPPLPIPSNHKIIAEKSGPAYVTHSINGSNTYLSIISGQGTSTINSDFISYSKFNPSTNTLFIFRYNFSFNVIIVDVYDITSNSFNLICTRQLNYNDRVVQVDNQNRLYIEQSGILKELNCVTGIYTTISISGFNNSNIVSFYSDANPSFVGPYTKDVCLVGSTTDEKIYALDFVNLTSSYIQTTGLLNSSHVWQASNSTDYLISGVDIFICGGIMNSIQIGSQQIPFLNIGIFSNYLTKLNLISDFSTLPVWSKNLVNRQEKLFNILAFPNPFKENLKIIIEETHKSTSNRYFLTLVDQNGIIVIQKTGYLSGNELDLSNLRAGLYYLIIKNEKGVFQSCLVRKP